MDSLSLRPNLVLDVAFPHPPTALSLRRLVDRELARSHWLAGDEFRFGLGRECARERRWLAPVREEECRPIDGAAAQASVRILGDT
jgi:hypothetical protein